MRAYKEIDGDLIQLALQGEFDVIVHGCNCFCNQKSGLAPQMVKAFGTDKFKMESKEFEGDINKLGIIDYKYYFLENGIISKGVTWMLNETPDLTVVNAYTQYYFRGIEPVDYEAITLVMRKINYVFKGKTIGLPRIGSGLAGGDEKIIENIIKEELKDCKVIMVNYKQN